MPVQASEIAQTMLAAMPVSRMEFAQRIDLRPGFPSGWQVEALQSEAPRILFNCTRQGGKSSVSAVLALYNALYVPGSGSLVVSEGERQSKNLLKTVRLLYSALRGGALVYESRTEIQLPSGSFIVALPGTGGASRSYADVSLLLIDEAARISAEAIDAATPTQSTAKNARLVVLSTPFGKRGLFYEWWEHGGDEWQRFTAKWHECPWIKPEFIAHEKARMSDAAFRQEYLCEFVETEASAFSYSDIEAAFQESVMEWSL